MAWRRRLLLCWILACFLLVCGPLIYFSGDKLEDDYDRLVVASKAGHISYDNLIQFKLGEELLSDEEMEAMRTVTSPDISTQPSGDTSTLHLVHNNRTAANHGDVTVRLDLRDVSGRKIDHGGHQIRMWITSVLPDERSAALRVTDLRNGSYVTSFPVLWPGKTVVHAAMFFSRDVHHSMTKAIVNIKNPQPFVGGFVRGSCKEATLCGPFPFVPGYSASCNHTSLNSGLGWYCGKPSQDCLSCKDLKFTRRLLVDYPRLEYKLYMANGETLNQTLTVYSDAQPPQEPYMPCSSRKSRDTWTDQRSPRGFFEKQTWHSLNCASPPWNVTLLKECFRGATLLFLGDSNARQMFQAACQLVNGYFGPIMSPFHRPLFCEKIRQDLDVKLAWYPHEYPLQQGNNYWYDMSVKKSPRYHMDRIPSTGKYFLLVHLFSHFLHYPSAVYTEHVKDVVRGARDLCRRNPSAKIVFRGPSCWTNEIRGDYLATMATEVLRREFGEIQDCVIYLDAWDVTVAANSCKDVHPPTFATKELTRTFLSYVC